MLGGGIVGTATAYAAALIGGESVEVDLYEAATIAHDGGASVDVTRVFRHAYGSRRDYIRWTIEALTLWQYLEQQTGQTLFERTGAAWLASAREDRAATTGFERPPTLATARLVLESSFHTLQQQGLSSELVDGSEFRHRYPLFAQAEIVLAMLDPGAGMLHARDAVVALRDLGERHGVRFHERMRAVQVSPDPGSCGVVFADGTSIAADVVVLAVNGWTPLLLPDLATRLQNTEQPLWYFTLPADAVAAFDPVRCPVFLFANAEVYGLPLHRGSVKIACDAPSSLIDQPEQRRLVPDAYRNELHAYLVRQLPALESATLMQERICFYDRSPDGDFILDQWDPHARLLVACGFSGHGFKFGPLTGARLARYALTGRPATDLAPFSLARFDSLPSAATRGGAASCRTDFSLPPGPGLAESYTTRCGGPGGLLRRLGSSVLMPSAPPTPAPL